MGPPPEPRDFGPRGPRANLRVERREQAPAPLKNNDARAAAWITRQLAWHLRVEDSELSVQVPHSRFRLPQRSGFGGDEMLGEGFIVARHQADGSWLTVQGPPRNFLNAFERQALLLFAIGLLLLLPLAFLFARALSAPIRRFAEGAHRLGHDAQSPPLPVEGPREMRIAVDAFNTMQARLNRLLQERTQMVGAIAHDLRTPLTRLAFRMEDLPDPLRSKVEADIQDMKQMISAALDFLRDRALSAEREKLDLRLLVERIVNDEADVGHEVELASGPPVTVNGAPLGLRRMTVNLVENALKYGHRARLRLREEEGQAILEVDDDGPGIPEAQLQQVFVPFFRLEASRNRDTGGIGLGLATARAIALDHGGDIALTNRRGGGLRATVRLPAA